MKERSKSEEAQRKTRKQQGRWLLESRARAGIDLYSRAMQQKQLREFVHSRIRAERTLEEPRSQRFEIPEFLTLIHPKSARNNCHF